MKYFVITEWPCGQVLWKRWYFLSIFLTVASNYNHCSRRWKIHQDCITCLIVQGGSSSRSEITTLCLCKFVHKKAKSFTKSGHSFLMYKLNSFSKALLSLIYCGISRAADPNFANVFFLALTKHCNINNSVKKWSSFNSCIWMLLAVGTNLSTTVSVVSVHM